MTDHSGFMVGGHPIADRLRAVGAVARQLVGEFTERIEPYRSLPREELDGDITRITAENVRLFIKVLETACMPAPEELAGIAASAAQRADEGVPLGAVLSAYHVGLRTGWDLVIAEATPADLADIKQVTGLLLEFLRLVTATVADAYLEQHRTVVDQQHVARGTLATELLRGEASETTAEQAGMRLAARYTVLALAIDRHADEDAHGVDATIAARRKVHRVQSELTAALSEPALATLGPDGGTVLIPGEPPWERLTTLVSRLDKAAGAAVTAAAAALNRDEIPGAAARLRQVVDLARATGRAPGLYRLADVLLDYQLTRPGVARRELSALLDPLADHPELLQTLEVHLGYDLNRRRTAATLHIHANTVDYRLRRIAELTGLDPAKRLDLRHLEAALVARRMEQH